MARNVKGSALVAGDVIQDQARTNDTHPFVVLARGDYQITLRNCTSHETSALTLVKVKKEDKTGDPGWAGNDSYVVKSGNTLDLNVYDLVTVQVMEMQEVPLPVPPQLVQLIGPNGVPYFQWYQPTQVVSVPRLVNRYSDAMYRVVGGIKAERVATLLQELAA